MLHLVAISIKKSSLVQKKHWHSNSSVVYSAENKTVDYKQTAKSENIFEIFSHRFLSQFRIICFWTIA